MFFNAEAVQDNLLRKLGDELKDVAEPILQKAMQDMERAMRKRLAECVVGLIQTDYNLSRDGRDLHIKVRFDPKT